MTIINKSHSASSLKIFLRSNLTSEAPFVGVHTLRRV